MRIREITAVLEAWAPRSLQESYDNSGLQLGDPDQEVSAALVCLEVTEAVVAEAVTKDCQLIISHHPLIFKGLKSLAGKGHVERTLLAALRNDIALYCIHTNLDNVITGVNSAIADRLQLVQRRVLAPRPDSLLKLVVFVPHAHVEAVRDAVFAAGGGHVGDYDECSFGAEGQGTFRPGAGTDPFVGTIGERRTEPETRLEFLLPSAWSGPVVRAMREAHPYEEVAHDLIPLRNLHQGIGSGLVGELEAPVGEEELLQRLKREFRLAVVRHSPLRGRKVARVALCGGSGAFLIPAAKAAGADIFITGDVKYHDFFEADGDLVIADIGHYGSEQFTIPLIAEHLVRKLPTFAVRLTDIVTDPIHYS